MTIDKEKLFSAISNNQKTWLADTGKLFARYAALPVMAGVMQYIFSRKNIKEDLEQFKSSYNQLIESNPSIKKNEDLAAERFRELCTISPTIAKNPNMAAKFIEPRLKSGLTIDDVHKLTMIQAHARSSPLSRDEMHEATARAGEVADRVFGVFGPRFLDRYTAVHNNYAKEHAKIMAKPPMVGDDFVKKSSQVSESCLGEMVADRYVLWRRAYPLDKTAGAAGAGAAGAGANYFKKGLAFFAAPLAIGGLVHGIGMVVDAKKKAAIEQEAQNTFDRIRRSSEHMQSNPELAQEAFDAIRTFAPSLAVKPNVLKTFIEHTIKTEQLSPQTVKELAETQGHIQKAAPMGFAQGFFGATKPVIDIAGSMANTVSSSKTVL